MTNIASLSSTHVARISTASLPEDIIPPIALPDSDYCDNLDDGFDDEEAKVDFDWRDAQDFSLGLISPYALPFRAATKVFLLPELRACIASFVEDPTTRENLAHVSKNWNWDLKNDEVHLRRIEKLLCIEPGSASGWELPMNKWDMARVTKRIATKKLDGIAFTPEEKLFQARLPKDAWTEFDGCIALSDAHFRRGCWRAAKAAVSLGSYIAAGPYNHVETLFDVPSARTLKACDVLTRSREAFEAFKRSAAVRQNLRENISTPLNEQREALDWRHEQTLAEDKQFRHERVLERFGRWVFSPFRRRAEQCVRT